VIIGECLRLKAMRQGIGPARMQANARIERLPGMMIGAIPGLQHQHRVVFDPAVHLLGQLGRVLFLPSLPPGPGQMLEMKMTVELGVPFNGARLAVTHGVGRPVNSLAKRIGMITKTANRKCPAENLVGTGGVSPSFSLLPPF